MAHLSEALLPPSGDSETCSSPRAGQGHISKEKAPESYSQHTPPTPTPMSCPPDLPQGQTAPPPAASISQRPQERDNARLDHGSFSIKDHIGSEPALKTLMSSCLLDIYWRSYIHLKLNMFR